MKRSLVIISLLLTLIGSNTLASGGSISSGGTHLIVGAALALSEGGSMSSGGSQSSTVTIYGKSADFLIYNYRMNHEDLNFTHCVRGARSPYLGTVECVMDVFSAKAISRGKTEITGYAADELYEDFESNPEQSGIQCFVQLKEDGSSQVACQLEAYIVETNGL